MIRTLHLSRVVRALVLAFIGWGSLAQPALAEQVHRIVVPSPPGGSLDLMARALASRLGAQGETYVVENRPGGGTMIGAEYVARAPADAGVLLFGATSLVIQPLLQKVHFSPMEELRPVIQVASAHYVLVAVPSFPAAGARDLAALAAARPQGLNCGAPPGPMFLACEQLRMRLGGKVATIPYQGIAPAVAALLGGHVDVVFLNVEAVDKQLEAGKLRALGASSPAAGTQAALFSEVWPGFVLEGFSGVLVPAGTPRERVLRLNREINGLLAESQLAAFMRETGQEPAGGTPEQFGQTLLRAHQRYEELVRKLGLQQK